MSPLPGLPPRLGLHLAVLALGLVATAFLLGRFAPPRRRKVRRALIPFALWLAALGLGFGLSATGLEARARDAFAAAGLLRDLTLINLAGLLLFDLALPRLGLGVADIVADLTLGAAYLLAILGTLRASGVNPSSLLATSAVVTGVIGLSLQATLGNILGGVALQLDHSVRVGDWLQLENGRQGRVTAIHWRHTVLETRDWDTLIVPNAALLAGNILILGQREGQPVQHRMWVYFNVDFRFAPGEVIAAVDRALQEASLPNVAADPKPHCICYDFAKDTRDSFAYYAVRYWLTDLAKDDPTSSLVRQRIHAALKRAGIPLAVPAASVFLSQDDPEHAHRKEARELDRRLAALESISLFEALTPEEKARIAPRIRPAPFTAGEVITRQGAEAHWLYVLVKGEVEVRLQSEGGEARVVGILRAPDFFGEMGVMTGARRSTTVAALGEVECFRIEKGDFQQILEDRPEVAGALSDILARRRVELLALQERLGAEERERRFRDEHGRILAGIRTFFGLDA
ncbi:mechanosensitive ion channel protein MscS [Geothrix rubra]|uniref:Mechanosensitive ion channel protein MscS n=1 Tax=Geothrix rubra TaxID=2927977 RepID=A0ABQ5Q8I2_9BACT|nr:mechanosensitive ion channel family protein [Geothrix rubra]GLH71007.1 mechanosensitive ion channel protein MscS [Geothrix rubra]